MLMIRFDGTAGGWIFPKSVRDSQFPTIEISLGDSNDETGAMSFSISPSDLVYADAQEGYHASDILSD